MNFTIKMEKLLKRFEDCDTFSLTGGTGGYDKIVYTPEKANIKSFEDYRIQYTITEEEFDKNVIDMENRIKRNFKKFYKKTIGNYPDFNELYKEIENECYNFYNNGKKEEKKASFIDSEIGKTTKYGKFYDKDFDFFYSFYTSIANLIDLKNSKKEYCIDTGHSPLEKVPLELRDHLLYYEISSYNAVTTTSGIIINYYFKLNDETKKYLLKYENDLCWDEWECVPETLDDLAFYKNKKLKFSSCTHEGFNSLEIDYTKASHDEVVNFINDIVFYENQIEKIDEKDLVIDVVNKLISMKIGTVFSFKELGVSSLSTMLAIYILCIQLNLQLISLKKEKYGVTFSSVTELIKKRR